ncbi:hypothetical protein [Haloarcula sp. JP-L23]|uniref:hypothetical protein n=1 Tax=Haloarcula sp. JP-L23 TaxID=2716717 RepID=UPI0018780A03
MTDPAAGQTRRGFLAVVGASALAGCGAVERFADGDEPTIRSHELPDVDTGDDERPHHLLFPAVPVPIEDAYLGAGRDRTTELLSGLPTPLGPDEIPNGHIREHLLDAADHATENIDDARRAETGLMALRAIRESRQNARYAAEGWRFVSEGRRAAPLREERRNAVAEARSFDSEYTYLGDDPVRAALVHARIETALRRATDAEEPSVNHDGSALLTVAEWGEAAESAHVYLDDARHLDAQFRASLPADAGTVEARLRGAAEALLADLRSRAVPPEPTSGDWEAPERVRWEVRDEAVDGTTRVTEAAGPASALLDATGRLAGFGALERVRRRIEEGEQFRVESAADVRRFRQTAVDALQSTLGTGPTPGLVRTVLTNAADRIWSADWELSRAQGDVRPAQLVDPVSEYVVATALARAAPDAAERTVDALESV